MAWVYSSKRFFISLLHLILISSFFISSLPASAKVFFLEAQYYQDKRQEKKIILGKGEIISSDSSIARVAVSDPSIADLQILNEKQFFVRAKQLGSCTFLIWESGKPTPTRFDISVWPDIESLTAQIKELDKNISVQYIPPSSNISSTGGGETAEAPTEATAAGAAGGGGAGGFPSSLPSTSTTTGNQLTTGKIILTGDVSNAEVIAKALQIAGIYVNDEGIRIISQPGGQIINGLSGDYGLLSVTAAGGAGGAAGGGGGGATGGTTQFGGRDQFSFTTNGRANLSRGVIVTTSMGSVISFIKVKNPPQISVAIRFYEITRTLSRDLGFNQTIGGNTFQAGSTVGGGSLSSITGGVMSDMTSFLDQALGGGATSAIFNPRNGLGLALQALQQRGEVKALAEPNLVISNGEPASFLAGGEIPIQRSVFTAGGTSQDISYEPFGIRFLILPTITGNNRIHLLLIPEIRDIDTEISNLVSPAGTTTVRPPAFKTRRTQTQVELESGEAIAISGLLREDNTRSLRKMPGISEIPIIGSLFRSKSFRKGETELLIVVSPKIVTPTKPEQIAELNRTKPVAPTEFDELLPVPKLHIHSREDEQGPAHVKDPIEAAHFNPEKVIAQETPENDKELKEEIIDKKPTNDLDLQIEKSRIKIEESFPQKEELQVPIQNIIKKKISPSLPPTPPPPPPAPPKPPQETVPPPKSPEATKPEAQAKPEPQAKPDTQTKPEIKHLKQETKPKAQKTPAIEPEKLKKEEAPKATLPKEEIKTKPELKAEPQKKEKTTTKRKKVKLDIDENDDIKPIKPSHKAAPKFKKSDSELKELEGKKTTPKTKTPQKKSEPKQKKAESSDEKTITKKENEIGKRIQIDDSQESKTNLVQGFEEKKFSKLIREQRRKEAKKQKEEERLLKQKMKSELLAQKLEERKLAKLNRETQIQEEKRQREIEKAKKLVATQEAYKENLQKELENFKKARQALEEARELSEPQANNTETIVLPKQEVKEIPPIKQERLPQFKQPFKLRQAIELDQIPLKAQDF